MFRTEMRSGSTILKGLTVWAALAVAGTDITVEGAAAGEEAVLRVAVFDVEVSPPVGSPLAYDPTKEILKPLSCRGVVLLGEEAPVVLCAVDWIGIGNAGQTVFREALAAAVGTTPERVAVHAVHQHDAPHCDFSTEALLAEHGLEGRLFDAEFARTAIDRAARAAAEAVQRARPVTHVGLGAGEVHEVASNRRLLGPDGKVEQMRFTAGATDPRNREAPVGTVDPLLRLVTLFDGEEPLVALAYFASHPQSFYRTGAANPDFPGLAREIREEATGVTHVYFTGAGGNIGAGKWNDGSEPMRQVLAERLADGMARAWEAMERTAVAAADLEWRYEPVELPLAPHLDDEALAAVLADADAEIGARMAAARDLAWVRRSAAGEPVLLGCLRLGPARILHMPGELFVEYQLAAAAMRPDLFVAMAAYGDYAMGYIGTEVAYAEGGYETSPRASLVAPDVEAVLTAALERLLRVDAR